MKKIIIIPILLLIVCISYAQETKCPKGRVNCTLGCGRFEDENNDGICDLSVPEAKKSSETVIKKDTSKKRSIDKLKDKTKPASVNKSIVKNVDDNRTSTAQPSISAKPIVSDQQTNNKVLKQEIPDSRYDFLTYTILSIIGYFLTDILHRMKVISMVTHKKIWNTVLLVAFIISGILGLYLVAKINYNLKWKMPFDIYVWHVNAGIVMAWISIFHAWWHLKYYLNLFKKTKKYERKA